MTDSTYFPLLDRPADAPVAMITQDLTPLSGFKGRVSAATFLAQVYVVADRLPNSGYVINLCDNRYLFTLLF